MKALILPAAAKMRQLGVAKLSIAIRNGKVAFVMDPEEPEPVIQV